ncbi:hypothetical protein [Pseudomonas sp. PDM27]|uniref:hypothetical protein n=1 Tax=Pseudomonas sp. PDM27 TaxID=2854769 RepID=UPI001C482527|nr:hypothetical protein [Pseudomonas sp. PDM27]MBV7566696.1 hypothetical protein [Pseudomonas sp. PDM27]
MINPTVEFLHTIDSELYCGSFIPADQGMWLEVRVGSLEGAQNNAVLKLDFEGSNKVDGSDPILETKTSLNHFLTPENIRDGVVLKIAAWEKNVKYVEDGSVRATLTINGGNSTTVLTRAHFLFPGGGSCRF